MSASSSSCRSRSGVVQVKEEVVTLEGWPTDVVRVDHHPLFASSDPTANRPHQYHTVLLFVPGNPGCIGWYTRNLVELVDRLGPGFCARGVSYAGHSPNEALTQVEEQQRQQPRDEKSCNPSVPWTIDGQIQHKASFVDYILSDHYKNTMTENRRYSPRFIFLSHSIGSHMVERLCIRRSDILQRTIGVVHLMPFIRMKASKWSERAFLDWGAAHPSIVTRVGRTAMHGVRRLPRSTANSIRIMDNSEDSQLALRLLSQPTYARNFFELGLEEIRDVPETIDVPALQWIGSQCPIAMLYAGNDQWAPAFHMHELQQLQREGHIPSTISFTCRDELRHDYVSHMHMVPTVVDWCLTSIQDIVRQDATENTTSAPTSMPLRSKL